MRLLAAALLSLSLLFAATAQALDKTQLATKANKICTKYTKQLDRLSQDDEQQYLDDVAEVAAEQQERLAALKATGKARKLYARFLDRYETAVQTLADIAAAHAADDAEELQALQKDLRRAVGRIDTVAAKLGAPACGR